MRKTTCWCGNPSRKGGTYCAECHNRYAREWRAAHLRRLTPEQRMKAKARRIAETCLADGKIKRKPCQRCGDPNSQMHHPDYRFPLLVEWYCAACHVRYHWLETQSQNFRGTIVP